MLTDAADGQRDRVVERGDAQDRSIWLANDEGERAVPRSGDTALKTVSSIRAGGRHLLRPRWHFSK